MKQVLITDDQAHLTEGYTDKENLSDDEIAALLIEGLKIKNPNKKIILGAGKSISIEELIEQVQNRGPLGLEYIEIQKDVRREIGNQKIEEPVFEKELTDDQIAEILIADLNETTELSARIYSGKKGSTTMEMVQEIENRTAIGLKHIAGYRTGRKVMTEIKEAQIKENQDSDKEGLSDDEIVDILI